MLPLTKNRIIYSILGLLLCLVGNDGFGQNQANNWYFSPDYAGVSFNTGNPVTLLNSAMHFYSDGGSACVSDTNGNILFYTEGETIWNRNHQIMLNGSGLEGDNSASQPALIVQKPGSSNLYYLFTIGSRYKEYGLAYNVIDISADGGNGAVIEKNRRVTASVWARDKLTAIKHKNGTGYWIITKDKINGNFHTYLLSSTGLNQTPIVSNSKQIYPDNWYGPIKSSQNKKLIISCYHEDGIYSHGAFELCGFNDQTGEIVSKFNIKQGTHIMNSPTGCEISPDSKFLYVTTHGYPDGGMDNHSLVQYDLTLNDSIAFFNSCIIIDTTARPAGLQLAPDGKIYGIRYLYPQNDTLFYYLDVIHDVWKRGTACNFESYVVNLQNRKAYSNLPNFPQDLLYRFVWSGGLCAGVPFNFRHRFIPEPDSIHWDFGDPGSGAANTSSIHNPTHVFSAGGTFEVYTYVKYPNGRIEETSREVEVLPKPYPNLGPDTLVCENAAVSLTPGSGFAGYYWNGSIMPGSPTYLASGTGTYIVRVKNNFGCYNADTIQVLQRPAPALDQTNLNIAPTTCSGTTGAITGLQVIGSPPLSFQWTASGTPISDSLDLYHLGVGLYELNVTDGYGCKNTVAAYTISDAGNILIDTAAATPAFCNKPDGTLTITAVSGLGKMLRYFIKTGSDTLSQWGNGRFTALTSGTYYAWVSDSSALCRSAYSLPILVEAISAPAFASVTATAEYCGKHDGQIAISMSPGYVPQLQYFILSGTDTVSQWGNPLFNSLSGGSYRVWASDSSGCTSIYPMLVNVDKLTAPVITSVSTTPENGTASDGTITVVGSGSGLTYSLNGGLPENNGYFTGLAKGSYSVYVSNPTGCDTTFTVLVGNDSGILLSAVAGNGSACLGKVAKAPLIVSHFNNVKSFGVTLTYDKLFVTCTGYTPPLDSLAGLQVILYPATGTIRATWQGSVPLSLPDSSEMFQLVFSSQLAGNALLLWDKQAGCVFTNTVGDTLDVDYYFGSILINSPPDIALIPDAEVCEGGLLWLSPPVTGNGPLLYAWQTPTGPSNQQSIFKTATLADDGLYKLVVTDTIHCADTASWSVRVTPTPVSGFTNDTLLFDQTYTLEANPGYYRYTWSTTDSTYSILVTAEGWYKVTLTTIGGCTATDSVLMLTAFAPLTMPNAFTPNGDIQNDVFKAVTTPEKIRSYTLYIYDRWGKQVYFTNDVTQGWDGTIDGAAAPVGTYVYYVKYSNTSGVVREKRGMVVLVR